MLVFCDAGAAGVAEIEDQPRGRLRRCAAQIARHQTAYILGQRDTEITGAPAGTPLEFGLERDLHSRHHDGITITSKAPGRPWPAPTPLA